VRPLLTLIAVVLVVLGCGLLLAPAGMATLYGAETSAGGDNGSRMAGAAIVALGTLAWLSRRPAYNALGVNVLFVWFALKSVVAWLAVRDHVFNAAVGWTVLCFDVFLALACGFFALRGQRINR